MAELSPAAQAVLDAANRAYWLFDQMCPADANVIAAAALRAVADHVVPLRTKTPWGSTINPSTEAFCIHAALYSIAAELDS